MAGKEERKRVLVVGGSGYLGQHLLAASSTVDRLDVAFTHHSPAPPQPLLETLPSVRAFRADLRSGDGFEAISASFGQVHTRPHSHRSSLLHTNLCSYYWLSSPISTSRAF
jgi:nucleoside-diphosphate-sugar epimerase